ncbi:acetate kinase [Leucobacter sp. UT-8R-CII-1-4]|uniref:acetate/propionate family kinase n=1 Tax=Leucobacter sp. UT-8R-CII-1-4 TaxID=3040075 RepID=UPI0024A7E3CC|nr:acetate kinase [Leucobacter sp. UT-8R-CII-1-4]MDI6022534.1 acetate kinase [Leucobacter sp. UT-8R-CII-1-4]
MHNILVINAGSSSIKYQLIDCVTGQRRTSGLVERIGEANGRVQHEVPGEAFVWETPIADHSAAFRQMVHGFAKAGTPLAELDVAAVGHRVVQGGSEFHGPTLITDEVAEQILALGELAPLHNPANYSAIVAARETFPDVPHVAVFDTAFHQTMPEAAYSYAIDKNAAEKYGVRRYGFHGISHQVVSQRAAALLDRPVSELKQIILHLGNGASACAIDGGRSVDTSMGMTPLAGLVMGTRSGDIDPGALLHLMRAGLDVDAVDRLLNKESGLLGLAGSNDMRDIRAGVAAGDEAAMLAFEVTIRRLKHYIGAYLALLGGADTIVFTAGVGENHVPLRAAACAGLEWFGIEIDAERNAAPSSAARVISSDSSRVTVLVVPTDEEAEIARQTLEVVAG